MNQEHLLHGKYLIGKCEIVTYIPEYKDIYKEDIEGKFYTSKILKETRMKHQEDYVNRVDTA